MTTHTQQGAQMPMLPLAEPAFEVRWGVRARLFRVWNNDVDRWANVPGFTDERVARAVAWSLLAPLKGERRTAKRV